MFKTFFDSEFLQNILADQLPHFTNNYFIIKHLTKKLYILILIFSFLTLACARPQSEENQEYTDAQNDLVDESVEKNALSNVYDPRMRDFTSRCMQLAQYSGSKACEVFNVCCSEDNLLNKLNGDRCKNTDSSNGCTLTANQSTIQWSLCRAFNCTEEVTTTTTTTTTTSISSSAHLFSAPFLLTLGLLLKFKTKILF